MEACGPDKIGGTVFATVPRMISGTGDHVVGINSAGPGGRPGGGGFLTVYFLPVFYLFPTAQPSTKVGLAAASPLSCTAAARSCSELLVAGATSKNRCRGELRSLHSGLPIPRPNANRVPPQGDPNKAPCLLSRRIFLVRRGGGGL